MPRWLSWTVTLLLTLVAVAAQVHVGVASVLPETLLALIVILCACGIGWLWGVGGGVIAGAVAAVLVSGAPVTRAGFELLLASTAETVTALGSFALPVFVATVATLRGQVHRHRDAAARAQFDPLTGLLNRVALEARLVTWIARARSDRRTSRFAVLFIDVDRFKVINDTYGHEVGDRVLGAVAQRLREHVRQDDLVARLGGDEFVIAMPGSRDRETAAAVAGKLVRLLAAPIDVGSKVVSVSASIGIAVYPTDGEDVNSLITSADNAMYAVKSSGKNAFVFSDVRLRGQRTRRLEVERRLRLAVDEQRLAIAYQPQIDLASGRVAAFEALMRWFDGELGRVEPSEFVPVAEEAGLIVPIGLWLLREACFQACTWNAEGARVAVAVNASSLQFQQADFADQVEAALRDSGLEPDMLEIEVSERVLIDHADVAVQTLRRLHRCGVGITLDDFGTGYSSLTLLQRLPIRALKIDRSFVGGLGQHDLERDGDTTPIVDAIVALGQTFGRSVSAEGIETPAQARYLRRISVDRAQGFHFGHPLPATAARRLVVRQALGERNRAQVARFEGSVAGPGTNVPPIELLLDGR